MEFNSFYSSISFNQSFQSSISIAKMLCITYTFVAALLACCAGANPIDQLDQVEHVARTAYVEFMPGITAAPLPDAKVLEKRQVDATDCTLTSNGISSFDWSYLVPSGDTYVYTTSTITLPAGLGCTCANDVVAGVITEYNNVG